MAHNLEIRNGEASMMYVGDPPWHGLGKKLDGPATAAEAIKAAHMDWEVVKKPLMVWDGTTTHNIPDRFAVIRQDFFGKPKPILGIVGKDYVPLQNREAFNFFDPIVGKDAAIYHTAGVLGDGERVWILAKLPGSIRVVGDDVVDKFLLLSNSHDGNSAVQVKFTPIRVVCQNTLNMALNRGRTVRVTHTRNLQTRMREAERVLGIVRAQYIEIEDDFKRLVTAKVDKNRLGQYLTEVFPAPQDKENLTETKRAENNRTLATYFFDEGKGSQLPGVHGTLWAAYNGVTELVDHRDTRQSLDRRLNAIWFGEGCSTKARAFHVAMELARDWEN